VIYTAAAVARATASHPASPGGDESVAYQIDAAHDGEQAHDALRPPLRVRWSRSFPGEVSYPLIAQREVFVVSLPASAGQPVQVVALSAQTGAKRWAFNAPSSRAFATIAYDNSEVFLQDDQGAIHALDASTGRQRWNTTIDRGAVLDSEPTAYRGVLYTDGPGGILYALNERSGRLLWQRRFANGFGGERSSPVVQGPTVYVTFDCEQVYAFDRITGRERWQHTGSCASAFGRTAALHNGLLWDRNESGPQDVLAARTGALVGHFDLSLIPAFACRLAFFLAAATPFTPSNLPLTARNLATGVQLWSFSGDGGLVTAPVTVGAYVYVASSSGTLYALATPTGRVAWSGRLAQAPYYPDEHDLEILQGFGAAEGLLVISEQNVLQAFTSLRPRAK
jgi:outer membrane protein assembly factor BamB